jgi:cytochrome c oxidase subunit 2
VKTPIRLVMTSEDVIHSFFVPAFRLKQDVLPVRTVELAFTPTETGDFHLFCAEFCGTQHSRMKGDIVVMNEPDYVEWLRRQPHGDTLAETGERLYARFGCGGCHGESSEVAAPKLAGLYGSTVRLQDGRTSTVDEAYLRRVILHPDRQPIAGYAPIMPSFAAIARPGEIDALIAYLKSLPQDGAGR